MADVLYGVTMQEQGLSKIVSVRFHKAAEEVMDHPAGLAGDAPRDPLAAASSRVRVIFILAVWKGV